MVAMKSCGKKMRESNSKLSEESIKRLCNAAISKRKKKKKSTNETYQKYENIKDMKPAMILQDYKKNFTDIVKLKYSEIKNYADLERIRNKISNYESRIWDLEYAYKRVSNSQDPEDDLLKIRIDVRKDYNKESNKQYEEDLLAKLAGKTKKQQFTVLKKEYPDWDEEFIKEIVGL